MGTNKKVGTIHKPTTKILCYFKDKDLLVVYPDHIGKTLPTHLYMYVNHVIEKSLKLLNVGDMIWDNDGNNFMLLAKDPDENSSDPTIQKRSSPLTNLS